MTLTVEAVLAVHGDVVGEYPDTPPGVRDRGAVEFAVETACGGFGERSSVHAEVFELLRLLVANHPFVDGNKRTALNVGGVRYALDGKRFDYGHGARMLLRQLATDAESVDREATVASLCQRVEPREERLEGRVGAIREVAAADRNRHRAVYDALADE